MKKNIYGLRKKLLVSIVAISLIPGIFGVSAIYLSSKYTLLNNSSQRLELLARNKSLILSFAISKEIIRLKEAILKEARPVIIDKIKESTVRYSGKTQKQITEELSKNLQTDIRKTIKLNDKQLAQLYVDISVYNASGVLVARMTDSDDELIVDKTDWFKKSIAKNSTATLISEPFMLQPKTNVIRFSFPIYEDRNKTYGVLSAILRVDTLFSDVFDTPLSEETGAETRIYSNDGMLMFAKGQPHKLILPESITDKFMFSNSGHIISADELNVQVILGFAKIANMGDINSLSFSGKQLYIVTKRPVSKAVSPIIIIVGSAILPGLAAGLVLVLISSIAVSRFVNPIEQLKRGADLIAHGNLDYRLRIKTGDEIEALCESFNNMTKSLKFSDQKLRMQAEKLQIRNEQLEQVNRLNSLKSEFLANTSHELRTPLNSIIGFSEILGDQTFGKLNEKQARYIENIKTSGRHLLDLINGILDLSKVEAGKMELHLEEVDLDTFLTDVEIIINPLIVKKQLQFSINKDKNLPMIQADSGKLKQIMYNLLSNAVKFTPVKGSVSIKVASKDKIVEISVSDSGVGISKEEQDIIFQEFKQGETFQSIEFKGTGLGLALTKQLIEMHGGKIWVESEPNKGSRFTFILPVDPQLDLNLKEFTVRTEQADTLKKDKKSKKIKTPVIPSEQQKYHLLALLNSELKNKKINEFTNKLDYPIHFALNIDEMVNKLEQLTPFAVIVDAELIVKNSWDYIALLQESVHTTEIPIIIVPINTKGILGIPITALDYIVKPIDKNRLMSVLHSCNLTPTDKNEPLTVLIADQNPISLDFLSKIFESEGFGAIKADNGNKVLELAHEANPDLIVMDLIFSNMTVFDIIHKFPEHKTIKNIPYILIYEKDIEQNDVRRLNKSLFKLPQKEFTPSQFADEIFKLQELRPKQAGLIDKKTGIYTFNFARRKIQQLASKADKDKKAFSVISININPEPEGTLDSASLKKIGSTLTRVTRIEDKIIFVKNNTFIVILDKTSKILVEKISQKMLKELNKHENLPDPLLAYNIEIDTLAYFNDATSDTELLEKLLARIKS